MVEDQTASFTTYGEDIDKMKPEQAYMDIIAFIENKHKCSGICHPTLFYLTQSIKEGPPT